MWGNIYFAAAGIYMDETVVESLPVNTKTRQLNTF